MADAKITWTQVELTTRARLAISGLAENAKPYLRVAAIGSLGQGAWSDVLHAKAS